MSKTLNQILADLGYKTEQSSFPGRKRILKAGKIIGIMSAGQLWVFLMHNHPSVFEEAVK